MSSVNVGKGFLPKTARQAIVALLAVQIIIALFWLSQGGPLVVKDSLGYLIMATRAAQIPFLADCHDVVKGSAHIYNGPYYGYLVNILMRFPGGFAPYHFLLSQIFHFGFVLAFFFLARLWRSVPTSFLIALFVLLEPLHHWDFLVIKPSLFTQATIGISLCLAAYGWKRRQLSWFIYSVLVLGIGNIFREANLCFLPIVLLLALLGGKNWKWRLTNVCTALVIFALTTIPNAIFSRRTPQVAPLGAKETFGRVVAYRMDVYGKLKPWILPRTMEYYYSLAPRLRDPALVMQFRGSSLQFSHAFVHERVYRYGDTTSTAFRHFGIGGCVAFSEKPMEYLKSCAKTTLLNWGLPNRSERDIAPATFKLLLRGLVRSGKPRPSISVWANSFWQFKSCPAPFEECKDYPPAKLISEGMVESLQRMPSPGYLSYLIGSIWDSASPIKGVFALVLLAVSIVRLLTKRAWSILLISVTVIGTCFALAILLALPRALEILVLPLPWIVWTAGMAFSSSLKDSER